MCPAHSGFDNQYKLVLALFMIGWMHVSGTQWLKIISQRVNRSPHFWQASTDYQRFTSKELLYVLLQSSWLLVIMHKFPPQYEVRWRVCNEFGSSFTYVWLNMHYLRCTSKKDSFYQCLQLGMFYQVSMNVGLVGLQQWVRICVKAFSTHTQPGFGSKYAWSTFYNMKEL